MITWYVIVLQVHTRKRQEKQAEEAAAQIPRGTNITSSFCVECFCQAYLRLMLTYNFTCSQKTSRRLSMWRSLHSTCSMEYRQRGRSSLQVHMEPTNICFLYMCIHIAIRCLMQIHPKIPGFKLKTWIPCYMSLSSTTHTASYLITPRIRLLYW